MQICGTFKKGCDPRCLPVAMYAPSASRCISHRTANCIALPRSRLCSSIKKKGRHMHAYVLIFFMHIVEQAPIGFRRFRRKREMQLRLPCSCRFQQNAVDIFNARLFTICTNINSYSLTYKSSNRSNQMLNLVF